MIRERISNGCADCFIEDLWIAISHHLDVKGLMSFHDASMSLRTIAVKEFVCRFNDSTLTPQDLKIKTIVSLINLFGEHRTNIKKLSLQGMQLEISFLKKFPLLTSLDLTECPLEEKDLLFLKDSPLLTDLKLTKCLNGDIITLSSRITALYPNIQKIELSKPECWLCFKNF